MLEVEGLRAELVLWREKYVRNSRKFELDDLSSRDTLCFFWGNEMNGQGFESFNNCLDLGSTKLIGINIT